jgi:hypothetical protein
VQLIIPREFYRFYAIPGISQSNPHTFFFIILLSGREEYKVGREPRWTVDGPPKERNCRKGQNVGDDAGQSKSIGYK